MNTLGKIIIAGFAGFIATNVSAIPIAVDVIAVVDESGSMTREHGWIGEAILSLNNQLVTTADGDSMSANYGLVGFGADSPYTAGHQHDVGGVDSQFGTATEFDTATAGLLLSGGTEDGYDGMSVALNYNLNADHATNIILVTDEDRDNLSSNTLDYNSMLSQFTSTNAMLNAVVNCNFTDASGTAAIGIDSKGNAFIADGLGGYTVSSGGQQSGYCWGTTNDDYVDLALATGGAAWDVNFLRDGGLLTTSFTAAFVDIKVEEIIEQQVPETPTLALITFGLLGLGWKKRLLKTQTAQYH